MESNRSAVMINDENMSCPLCDTVVRKGLFVCRGCQSVIIYDATHKEKVEAAKLGAAMLGIVALLLFLDLPYWLASLFSWRLSDATVPVALALAIGSAFYGGVLFWNREKRKKAGIPRFFR